MSPIRRGQHGTLETATSSSAVQPIHRTVKPSFSNRGRSAPLGATVGCGGVNFSLYSRDAAEIELLLEDSPSLRGHLQETLQKTYVRAVKDALDETGLAAKAREFDIPETCPYTLPQLLEGDLDVLAGMLA